MTVKWIKEYGQETDIEEKFVDHFLEINSKT